MRFMAFTIIRQNNRILKRCFSQALPLHLRERAPSPHSSHVKGEEVNHCTLSRRLIDPFMSSGCASLKVLVLICLFALFGVGGVESQTTPQKVKIAVSSRGIAFIDLY